MTNWRDLPAGFALDKLISDKLGALSIRNYSGNVESALSLVQDILTFKLSRWGKLWRVEFDTQNGNAYSDENICLAICQAWLIYNERREYQEGLKVNYPNYGHKAREIVQELKDTGERKFKPGDRVLFHTHGMDEDYTQGVVQRYAIDSTQDQVFVKQGWNILVAITDNDGQGFWVAEDTLIRQVTFEMDYLRKRCLTLQNAMIEIEAVLDDGEISSLETFQKIETIVDKALN